MLENVVLTRGQVWMTPEIREVVGFDRNDEQMGFSLLLEEALQATENDTDRAEMAHCA